jgi:uncharacterized protein YecT (DUF1311 family)
MQSRLGTVLGAVAIVLSMAGPAKATEDIDCENASTTVEMNYCGEQEYLKADAELNRVYKAILDGIDSQAADSGTDAGAWKDALKAAQRAWVDFKEKDCGDLIGYEWGGGTGAGPAAYGCLIQKTKMRVQELKDRYQSQ